MRRDLRVVDDLHGALSIFSLSGRFQSDAEDAAVGCCDRTWLLRRIWPVPRYMALCLHV